MTMRDIIEAVIEDCITETNDCGRLQSADCADAILAALPDMIAPLVWAYDAGWHNAGHYVIKGSSFEQDVMWSYRGSYCRTVFKNIAEAKDAANTHHRAAIMAAFTGVIL
jgi:hypothetical protein